VQRHHSTSLQTVDIINDLRAQPDILQELGFPSEHCRIAARQLGVFTGFGGLQHCTTDRADLGQLFRSQPSSTRPPFSQPDDVFTP
jgi:hypothetical protein